MKLTRQCNDCGKQFTAVIDDNTGHVLIGVYWGKMRDPREGLTGDWSSYYLPLRQKTNILEQSSFLVQFMERNFWWYTLDQEKCTIPNWKKPLWLLYGWIRDTIKPPNYIEMWTCPKCDEVTSK